MQLFNCTSQIVHCAEGKYTRSSTQLTFFIQSIPHYIFYLFINITICTQHPHYYVSMKNMNIYFYEAESCSHVHEMQSPYHNATLPYEIGTNCICLF